MMQRSTSERCGTCGYGLTWIEIAFGQIGDPVCGRCLKARRKQRCNMWASCEYQDSIALSWCPLDGGLDGGHTMSPPVVPQCD